MKQAATQLARYSLVGLVSNGVGYLLYILLTRLGLGPKFAMSLLYGVGILQTFVFNKKWAFRFDGAATAALIRYATAYAFGYVVNFVALLLLVDRIGLPHQLVQGVMILVVAVMLFLAHRYWVFPQRSSGGVV